MSKNPTEGGIDASRRLALFVFGSLSILTGAWFFVLLPTPLRAADQMINTGILLTILALYLFIDFQPRRAPPGSSAGRATWVWGVAGTFTCTVALLLSPSMPSLLLLFTGTACLLRAAAGAFLNASSRRLLNPLFGAFVLFGALLIALPLLDMPLRVVAGKWSAHLLDLLHQETQLGFVVHEGQAMLLLVVNGRPFHVAAECNGFGLLGTSLILTLAFIFYRRVGWIDAVLLLIAAGFLALLGNLVRILIIIFLAPRVGEHYHLMHEIVGTIAFYSFLAAQWWLIMGFGRSPRPARSNSGPPQ